MVFYRDMMRGRTTIEISHRTIIFTVVFLLFVWFLFFIREILLQLFVALMIMTILNPLVTRLKKQLRIPRALSVIIVYVIALSFIVIAIGGLVQPLIDQSTRLANSLPDLLVQLNLPVEIIDQVSSEVLTMIGQLPAQILSIGVSIFSNIVTVFAVLIIALYLLISREKIDEYLDNFLSDRQVAKFEKIVDDLETRLGGWARGQLILMFVVGTLTYVGLSILQVPFALPLAVLAGLLEFIPNLGPIVAAIPAVVVGLSVTPVTGLAVAALSFLIQQLEAYLIVPQVMNRSAGVSPVSTLISLAIGFKVAGVVGALLAVPVYLTIKVIASHLVHFDKH